MRMSMRGFFGIGVEGIHKPHNLGNLVRSAHAFDASFFFTVSPALNVDEVKQADTSGAYDHLPLYEYDRIDDLILPKNCALVAVEFVENSVNLPSFRHPLRAAYLLGPEMGSVSDTAMKRATHVIKIPSRFCINVGVAGAIVMYDRMISLGGFTPRPVHAGGVPDDQPKGASKSHSKSHGRKDFSVKTD
jgi:tRNA G18 (ribose-2'-O)-methylase SpoU